MLTARAPQCRPKGRLSPYGKPPIFADKRLGNFKIRCKRFRELYLYDALHHRLNGVVRYFVIEARAVAVGCAAKMLNFYRRKGRFTAAYEVGFAVDIGNDEPKTAVYRQQHGAVEFEGGGVGRAAALLFGLATAFRLIEKLHRGNGGKHRHW